MAEATLFDLTQRCPRCQGTFGSEGFHPKKWGVKGSYCRWCCTEHLRDWMARRSGKPSPRLPRHQVLIELTDLRIRSARTGNRLRLNALRQRRVEPTIRSSYIAAHGRLKTLRGRAADHDCAECGKQADEWAYDHEDPDEIEGHTRRGRVAVYSENPDHYQPMCRSCHAHHDRTHWFADRLAPVLDAYGIDAEVRDVILKEIKGFR